MYKVSIIIPVYNVEKYLEECLTSVINQTMHEIEIICVNDSSTDRSLDILNEFAQKDNRIKIINNSNNMGLSYSRNRGLEISHGDYVYFLDSDDMITSEAMDELYIISTSQNLDSVFFDSTIIFETEFLRNQFSDQVARSNEYPGIYIGYELFNQFILNNEWTPSCPRQFWRRNFLVDHGLKFYEGIIYEDVLFSFLATLKANRVSCVRKNYFIRRYRENSITTTKVSKKNFIGAFICYCEMLVFWTRSNFSASVNNAIDREVSRLFKVSKHFYKICRRDLETIELQLPSTIHYHFYRLFISDMYEELICKEINEQKIGLIRRSKHVIIYGAGMVAREVLKILDKKEISILGFAVSDPTVNPKSIMGTQVYSIEDLIEYRDSAIVLVSVVQRYQQSIIEKLRDLRFDNFLLMS